MTTTIDNPTDVRIRLELQPSRASHREEARAVGGPVRAPHHSTSELGILQEIALSACGAFLVYESSEWRASALRTLFRTVAGMDKRARPALFVVVESRTEAELVAAMSRTYALTCNDPSELFASEVR